MKRTIINGLIAGLSSTLLVACGGTTDSSSSGSKLMATTAACYAAWNSTIAYTGGQTASYNGVNYTAAYWTQGQNPSTNNGPAGSGQPWISNGACGSTPTPTPAPTPTPTPAPTPTPTPAPTPTPTPAPTPTPTPAPTPAPTPTGSCPQYVSGHSYATGDKVTNVGNYYQCTVGGWCSLGGAYEPGVGWAWTNAWSQIAASQCGGTPTPTPTPAPTPAPTPTPTPAPTPTPTPAPTPTPSGTLAKHALIGYWHNFTNPAGNTFPLSQISSNWDVIVVAFADNAGSGNVSFTLDPNAGSEATFINDIKNLHAQGKKVVLSLGGQNGSVTVGSDAEATNFANSLYSIITKYGFDGIDLDLESGVSQGAAIQTYLPKGVQQLKAKLGTGSNFYLSMAPEWPYVQGAYISYGSIWGAYIPIINALRNDLTVLHPQYYNNGDIMTPYSGSNLRAGSEDQLVASSRMLIEGFAYGGTTFAGLRPDQVAFGVPSGSSSANSGFTTSTDVNNALDCLTKLTNCGSIKPNAAYSTFRGVMTWSINWDKHDGFNFSGPIAPHLHALP